MDFRVCAERGISCETRHLNFLRVTRQSVILARNAGLNNGKRCMASLQLLARNAGFEQKRGILVPKLTTRQLNFSMFEQSTQLDSLNNGHELQKDDGHGFMVLT